MRLGCITCRLSDGQSVQMLTALILQLLQCTVIPFYDQDHQNTNKKHESNDTANQSKVHKLHCTRVHV